MSKEIERFKDNEGDTWIVLFKNNSYSVFGSISKEGKNTNYLALIAAKIWPHAATPEFNKDGKGLTLELDYSEFDSYEECDGWIEEQWSNRQSKEWYPFFIENINTGVKKEKHRIQLN